MALSSDRLRLDGFNNLTKCLSFNLYDFVVAKSEAHRASYVRYIDERFSGARISAILERIAAIIDAKVLNISHQDYDPHGASSLLLMSDLGHGSVAAHLNKSHICAHTYPDWKDPKGICSFRVDIDIATCGTIVPLRALDYMFESFQNDVVIVDYVVRGFTRDAQGRRVYMDHELRSIQDFIDPEVVAAYRCEDLALPSKHIWQTKMIRRELHAPEEYFAPGTDVKTPRAQAALEDVRREMRGVFEGAELVDGR